MNDGSEIQRAGIVVGDCLVRYLHESVPAGAQFNGIVHSREILEYITGIGVSNPLILVFQPALQSSRRGIKLQRATSFPRHNSSISSSSRFHHNSSSHSS